MRSWRWMNGTTMGLWISSQYLRALKLTSIKCNCVYCPWLIPAPYHNPTTTMRHSVHNVDISKPLAHTMPYTQSAICPVQLKQAFIREEYISLVCQWPSKVSICPLKSFTTPNFCQVNTLVRMTSTQTSFPGTCSESLSRNSSVVQTHSVISCPVVWSQTIPQVKKPDVEILGLIQTSGLRL